MSNDSDSGSAATVLGVIASIIGILAFFGVTNWDDLKEATSSDASEDAGTGGDVVDNGADDGDAGLDDTDPGLEETEPEPEIPDPEPEAEDTPFKELADVAVGDCLQPVTPLTVVSCADPAAEYIVLARLPYDPSAYQQYPDSPTYEAATCASAGWYSTNSAGNYAIEGPNGREVLCVGYVT